MTNRTKEVNCIDCQEVITVSVFASPKSARCEKCKNTKYGKSDVVEKAEEPAKSQVDAYGEKISGPRIDGSPNRALARLSCPFHPHVQMTIIGVIKSDWGDIVDLQCREPRCWTKVSISEQSKNGHAIQTTGCGTDFEPAEVINHLENGTIRDWHNEHKMEGNNDDSSSNEEGRE